MAMILGIIFIGYYLYLYLQYGGLVFSEFFLIQGIVLILFHVIKPMIHHALWFYTPFKIIILIFITIFVLFETLILTFPKQDTQPADYVIVLGAAVKQTTLSLTLKARLDATLSYLNQTQNQPMIVVTGGMGDGEAITEAEAMKTYLIQNGIDESQILLEEEATNTFQNFKFSKEKIETHSQKKIDDLSIKVVTSDFHCFRSYLLAKRNHYEDVTFYSSISRFQFAPTYYTREFFALIKALIFN